MSLLNNLLLVCSAFVRRLVVLFEDNSQNIMHESLTLFEDVVKNPIFSNTPLFLFLNKKDLFEVTIKTHPLSKCFPDYEGAEGDMGTALDFIKSKFAAVVEKHSPGKVLHTHVIGKHAVSYLPSAYDL